MRPRGDFIEPSMRQQPTLEELDGFKGREIAGIKPVAEHFSQLEIERDFAMVAQNPYVTVNDDAAENHFLFINPTNGNKTLTIEAPHWRVISENNVPAIIQLPSGRKDFFYTSTTKGVGYLKPTAKGYNFDGYSRWYVDDEAEEHDMGYKVLGFSSEADYDKGKIMEKSNFLLESGLRTECYWGVAQMKRLPYKGEFKTIEELKQAGQIPDLAEYRPCQAVRLLKTNHRIEEAYKAPERAAELFVDAFAVFNMEAKDKRLDSLELKIGNPEHEKIFFQVFFERMGENAATLLNIGYTHYRLHSANITLAAEVGDVGTMGPWDEEDDDRFTKKYNGVPRACLKDMRDICYGLRFLTDAAQTAGLEVGEDTDLKDFFLKGFNKVADTSKMRGKGITAIGAKRWMDAIITKIIIDRGQLASLQKYEVEDWDI